MNQEPATMNVATVSDYIGCSQAEVRKLIRTKDIPYRKIGIKYVFDTPVIELWKKNSYGKEGFKYEC